MGRFTERKRRKHGTNGNFIGTSRYLHIAGFLPVSGHSNLFGVYGLNLAEMPQYVAFEQQHTRKPSEGSRFAENGRK